MMTAAGALSGLRSRMNGTRKLPHTLATVQTATVASPGRTTGTTMWRTICSALAPNTRADSS
jgi:hypothetical protein